MDIQVGTRIWDALNNSGMTVIEVRLTTNGYTRFICKDDSHHVGNWTLAPEDFEDGRFEVI